MVHDLSWALRPDDSPTQRQRASVPVRGPRCRQCGEEPLLARREPFPDAGPWTELRTYECADCGLPTRIKVVLPAA